MDQDELTVLVSKLYDSDAYVRRNAVRALGQLGDVRAVKPLVAMLEDREWYVRLEAVKALVKLGTPAVEPLLALLLSDWASEDVRLTAVTALGRLVTCGPWSRCWHCLAIWTGTTASCIIMM